MNLKMANDTLRSVIHGYFFKSTSLLITAALLLFSSCAIPEKQLPPAPNVADTPKKEVPGQDTVSEKKINTSLEVPAPRLQDISNVIEEDSSEPIIPPSYEPALSGWTAFDEKLFSFSARSAPLQDVLIALSKEANLNLVLGQRINALAPVSVEFTNLPLRQAMEEILRAFGYSYEINGNMLRIRAIEKRVFHFDYPLVYTSPTSSAGGDMLGSSESAGGITASFSVDVNIEDEESLNIWKQIKDILQPAEDDSQAESGGSGSSSSDEGGDETTPLLSSEGRATIDSASGTIIVFDRPDVLDTVELFLLRMKESLRRQVLIEAKIIEVQLNHAHQYGLDWAVLGDRLELPFTLETNLQTNTDNTGAFNFKISNNNSNADVNVQAIIDFISTQGDVNTISSPRIHVLNNQSATISIGTVIPYLDFSSATDSTTSSDASDSDSDSGNNITIIENDNDSVLTPRVTTAQAGISLGITPQISATGVITLHVIPVITDQVGNKTFEFEGINWTVPILDTRTTSTIISARDGETVVLGGLMQDKSSDNRTSVPILSKLPFFGKTLFANQSKQSDKTELVILLTPRIMTR